MFIHAIRWIYRTTLPVVAGIVLIVVPEFRLYPVYVMGSWFTDVTIRILITYVVVTGLRGLGSTAPFESQDPNNLTFRVTYDLTRQWGVPGFVLLYLFNGIGYCTIIGLIASWSISVFLPFLGNHFLTYALVVALMYALGLSLRFQDGLGWARAVNRSVNSNRS